MKESHGEGLASHTDPESCSGRRKVAAEAGTGARAGRVLSRETVNPVHRRALRGADAMVRRGRPHWMPRRGERQTDLARSETPYTHGYLMRGSREIPWLSAASHAADRIAKSQDARR